MNAGKLFSSYRYAMSVFSSRFETHLEDNVVGERRIEDVVRSQIFRHLEHQVGTYSVRSVTEQHANMMDLSSLRGLQDKTDLHSLSLLDQMMVHSAQS